MKHSWAAVFGLFFFIFQHTLTLPATNGHPKFEESDFLDHLDEELHKHAQAYGLEKEYEILKEALDRIRNDNLEGFDETVDPSRIGPHRPSPDSYRNVTELITSKGYGCEEHYPVTSDGYVLALQRIRPRNNVTTNSSKVILLQHGLLDSAATWVMNQDYNSLGFMLADQGFDVWLSNSRGNEYSHTNIHVKSHKKAFWQFSWDEMAKIDLPTFVDYVTLHTGVDKIYYGGHSQGTLIAFTGFSMNKDLANKIEHFFAMAPIISMGRVEGPMKLLGKFHQVFYDWLNLFGYEEFLPSSRILQTVGRDVCSISPITCEVLTFLVAGRDWAGYNRTRSDVYYTHFPAGTSLMDINHWGQMITSGLTQMYDYGTKGNKRHYKQKDAPLYNVTGLSVPTSLFYGGNDYLADVRDVEMIRETIPDAVVYDLYLDGFNHLDFVWGITAYKHVYNVIIQQIHNGV